MKRISVIVLLFFINAFAQDADSLYKTFIKLTQERNGAPRKCAFDILSQAREIFARGDKNERKALAQILSRPVCDTYIELHDGEFILHYDLSGTHAPTYSVEELAEAFENIYATEIENAGFPPPPSDNEGVNGAYDIYIQNIGNVYGYTTPEEVISASDSTYTSFIIINSDFSGFNTEGIDAAKVTLAHEFHHAIQIGNYIMRTADLYFYELSSTSMEEFVFPQINDYVAYLPEYFNNTTIAFPDYSGYNLGIWDLFLKAKYGFSILTSQWEKMKTMRAAFAIERSLKEYGNNSTRALAEFGVWTYFTNFRAQSGKYFDDAALYPLVHPAKSFSVPPAYERDFTLPPLASYFIQAEISSSARPDTLVLLAVNGDVAALFPSPYERTNCAVTIYDNPDDGEFAFASNYSYDFSNDNPDYIALKKFINNEEITGETEVAEASVYPQPFVPQKHQALIITLDEPTSAVTVAVYASDMSRVLLKDVAVWGDGKTISLNKNLLNLPSGIYIFTLYFNDKTQKGKFAIINER